MEINQSFLQARHPGSKVNDHRLLFRAKITPFRLPKVTTLLTWFPFIQHPPHHHARYASGPSSSSAARKRTAIELSFQTGIRQEPLLIHFSVSKRYFIPFILHSAPFFHSNVIPFHFSRPPARRVISPEPLLHFLRARERPWFPFSPWWTTHRSIIPWISRAFPLLEAFFFFFLYPSPFFGLRSLLYGSDSFSSSREIKLEFPFWVMDNEDGVEGSFLFVFLHGCWIINPFGCDTKFEEYDCRK